MSLQQFRSLAMLSARAFYDDDILQSVDPGVAVVIFDALARSKWVREEVLAEKLQLSLKQLNTTLGFLVQEELVTMELREETAKVAQHYYGAPFAAPYNTLTRRQGVDKITHSYFCLDYARMHDVVSYRLLQMNKILQDELDSKNTVQDIGDADENARTEHLTYLLEKIQVQLKPLTDQLSRVKDLEAPDYGTLQEWELRRGSNAAPTDNDSFGETEINNLVSRIQRLKKKLKDERDKKNTVQDIGDADENARSRCEKSSEKMEVELKPLTDQLSRVKDLEAPKWGTLEQIAYERLPLKGLPSWMIKQKMIKERMVKERKQKSKMEGTSAAMDLNGSKEKTSLKDELKGKRLLLPSTSSIRQRDDVDFEGDSKREETPTSGTATPYPPIIASEKERVIALLWESAGQYFTAEQINDSCGVDVEGNKALFKSLAISRKVEYDQGIFSYQSKYNVRNQIQLVHLIRRSPDGIPVADLEESYPAAMKHLQALKGCGDIWLLRNTYTRLEIAYPRYDASVPFIEVDDELKKLFRSVDLPSDLPQILVKNRIESKSAKRRIMAD